MRERVRTEARSALDAGEAGRAGHQERVVYQCSDPTCKQRWDIRSAESAQSARTDSERHPIIAGCAFDSAPNVFSSPAPSTAAASASSAIRRRSTASSARRRSPRAAHPRARLGGPLRAAARLPLGRAGEHDRNRPRARRDPPRAGLFALQRDARADGGDARDLDVLVIDLQDVGTRIYTYIYTMANCLIAARRHGIKVIVCDRPNPIGGVASKARCSSAGSSRSSASIRSRCGTA